MFQKLSLPAATAAAAVAAVAAAALNASYNYGRMLLIPPSEANTL